MGQVPQRANVLRLYGAPSGRPELPWDWVDRQLTEAGTYWVVGPSTGHPHPRPVWGVWLAQRLFLSVGSPTLRRTVTPGTAMTVHLSSGTDVVIVEGTVVEGTVVEGTVVEGTVVEGTVVEGTAVQGAVGDVDATDSIAISAYNRKYDWDYQVSEYGELTQVAPGRVLAWQAAGPFGRAGFERTGSWTFEV